MPQTPAQRPDAFSFRRDIYTHTILVTAVYIPRQQTWGMISKLDGTPFDHRQSIDPWTDARVMIDDALMEIDLEGAGVPSGLIRPPPIEDNGNSA